MLVAAVTGLLLAPSCRKTEVEEHFQIGEMLPDFSVTTTDGKKVTTSDLKGKPSIVIIFTTTCPDCTAQLPEVETVFAAHKEDINVLAVNRGEKEEALKVNITVGEGLAEQTCCKPYVKNQSKCGELVRLAACDSCKRLIVPSIIREVRNALFEDASAKAIRVFASNLGQLLMQPPLKNTVTLGLDPAYRTGCKLAVVDGTGKVLDTGVIYPTPPHNKIAEANKKVTAFVDKYHIEAVSIGNGTASRESESFIAEFLKEEGAVQTESGLAYKIIEPGSDKKAVSDQDTVWVNYKGALIDGTVFDQNDNINFTLNRVIKGWGEGMKLVGEGGKIKLVIPGDLGYGEYGTRGIAPNSTLVFDVDLNKVGTFVAPAEEPAKKK